MDTTRRTLLKGMAAAPLVAAAGGLLVPSTAEAVEPTPPEFRVTHRDHPKGTIGYTYPATIAGLLALLPNARPETVIAGAPHQGVTNLGLWAKPDRLAYAFAWDADTKDSRDPDWFPQGITTSYDSRPGGRPSGKRMVLVSWYARKDGSKFGQGARVSFVDVTDPANPRYEHVLLVEPRPRPGVPYDFRPVNVHAGGIAWHRDRLYVADTKGGLRVFNTDQMFRTSTDGPAKSRYGYHVPTRQYHAYGYRYALPQSRAYDNAGAPLTYSQVAIDHSVGPPTLFVSEFKRSGTSWLVRWHLDPVTGAITTEQARAQVQVSLPKIQGAVSWQGHHFFSLSNKEHRGYLAARVAGATQPGRFGRLSIGPEDLSFSAYGGNRRIWGLGEYPYKRHVYAVRLPRFDRPPGIAGLDED